MFANGGYRVKPYFIRRSSIPKGTAIFEESPVVAGKDAEQAIDPRNAFIMTTMLLRDVVRAGTATKAMALGRGDLAGKTGTTNDSVDAWFADSISRWWASRGLALTSRSHWGTRRPVAALRCRSGSTT